MTMSFKWQDKHMELFLETYRQHECLWNTQCSNYSKTNAREQAYSLMLSDLNIPGVTIPDIKAKIKTIRTRYGSELAKIRKSQSDGSKVYEPRLFWFKDADKFLRSVCTPKPSYLLTGEQEVMKKEVSPENEIIPANHTIDIFSNSADNSRIKPIIIPANISSNIQSSKTVTKRHSDISAKTSGPVKRMKFPSTSNQFRENRNEFDVFCDSLAIQLKKMPLERAIICQGKLQNVMTQERLFQLSETYAYQNEDSMYDGKTEASDLYSMVSSTGFRDFPTIKLEDTFDNQSNDSENEDENTNENENEDENENDSPKPTINDNKE